MCSFRSKDKRARALVAEVELSRIRFRFFLRTSAISFRNKQKLNFYFVNSLRNFLPYSVRARNTCVLSGRPAATFRYFRLSRLTLKELASRGLLTGVRKSSW